MEKDTNNIKIEELSDEELKDVVGGVVDWDKTLKYLTANARKDPDFVTVIKLIRTNEWHKAFVELGLICIRKGHMYPELVALFEGK